MGNLFAIGGVVLLFLGIVLVGLLGDRRSATWAPYIGVALALLGLGVEVVGAVVVSA